MVLEDLQQYSRRNCVIISGVPEESGEKTDDVVKSVAAKIKVTLTDQDIDRTHRVGTPKSGKSRPIICKLTRYNKRHELMKARRGLKGTSIGIQEQLTTFKQYLLEKAQDLVKKLEIARAAWSWDGRITILVQKEMKGKKSYVHIRKIQDLNALWNEGQRYLERNTIPVSSPNYARVDFDSSVSDKE
jgi:hypothetical protein